MGRAKKNFIKGAIKNPGGLHKSLGIPQDKKIPALRIKKAEHSKNPTVRKQAYLAETLKKMH